MKPALPTSPPLFALLAAAVLAAGCGSTAPSKLYTPEAQATEGARLATEARRIEVVSVRIPDLWDRPQIVLTKPGGEVDFNEFNRWAVPLKSEVPRIVTRNLTRLLGTQMVWLREDFPGAKPDLRVQVSIDQIEAVAGQQLRLEAAWAIRGSDAAAALKVGRSVVQEPLSDGSYAAVVAATSRALLALSRDVARDIAAIPAKP